MVAGQPLYDMGGGAGFPGLVFGLLNPDKKVVLIDKDARRIEFASAVIKALGLSNVSIVSKGLDELPALSVHNVVSRAGVPLAKAMLAVRKQVAKGGKFFHMKGDAWATELSAVPSQLFSFWSPSLLGQHRIPETSNDAAVVLTEKTAD
jgi:16S rRNA (guanine527-N7)-methyltransferase